MMPRRPHAIPPRHIETITISSSDDDHDMEDFDLAGAPQSPGNGLLNMQPPDHDSDWEEVLRITRNAEAAENAHAERTNEMTEDDCLARILEVFSDIAHNHVVEMFRAKKVAGKEANGALCDEMIVEILDGGSYPKEREVRRENLKRKFRASSEESEPPVDAQRNSTYKALAIQLLLNEFLLVPKRFINTTVSEKKSAFHSYIAIEEADRTYTETAQRDRLYRRPAKSRIVTEPNGLPTDTMRRAIQREITSAKKKVEKSTQKRKEKERKRLEEEENESVARANGDMTECGCCFCEFPTNRMTFCGGEQLHFFCKDCARSYVSNEIGQRKCRPTCMDTGGCGAQFPRSQLKAFLEPNLFDTLERLQQEQDLRDAGIEDLEQCPFCDFKAICEPKEVDREFRCLNDDCLVVSCRLCRLETHVPLTCEQAAKDKKIDVRHKVEEAMTAALIRECNKCKNKFIKEYGCNKMTCPSCRNLQCYVCSKDVKDYNHFSDKPGGCPLYENTEQRHDEDVKNAEKAAFEELKKENPAIDDKDLKIQVSEAVKKAEKDRIKRGARHPGAAGYHHGEFGPDAHLAGYYLGARPPPPARVPQLQDERDLPRVGHRVFVDGADDANPGDGGCPCATLDPVRDWYPRNLLARFARDRGCRCGRYNNANPEAEPNGAAAAAVQNPPPVAPAADLAARFRDFVAFRGPFGIPPPMPGPLPMIQDRYEPARAAAEGAALADGIMRQRRREEIMEQARLRQEQEDAAFDRQQEAFERQRAHPPMPRLVGRMARQGGGGGDNVARTRHVRGNGVVNNVMPRTLHVPRGGGANAERDQRIAALERMVDRRTDAERQLEADRHARDVHDALNDARRYLLPRTGRVGRDGYPY
ncbi:hypothetical protein HDK64DRAFT_52966 [Phyllosticta capitalensis]